MQSNVQELWLYSLSRVSKNHKSKNKPNLWLVFLFETFILNNQYPCVIKMVQLAKIFYVDVWKQNF